MLRHQQQSIRMALAAALHHSSGMVHAEYGAPRGLKTATRAGEEGHEDKHDALRRQKPPPPQRELCQLFEEGPGGRRQPSLGEPPGPQARVLRQTVEPIIESFVPVPMVDVPVPQMVDQLSEVVKFFVTLPVVAEQVIEVPTITLEDTIPQRSPLRAPQLAEQLVEVPVPSFRDCVIQQTLSSVVLSRHLDADGCEWCHCSGPGELYWWLSGTQLAQWTLPEGPRAVYKYWAGLRRT